MNNKEAKTKLRIQIFNVSKYQKLIIYLNLERKRHQSMPKSSTNVDSSSQL